MATTYYNDIQKLYVAYFNRPADQAGLDFWEKQLDNKAATLADIAKGFAGTDEYKTTYAGMTNEQVVTAIYQNLFNRAPDADGLAFWAGHLNAKDFSVDYAVINIANAAKNTAGGSQDLSILNNKIAASGQFTAALDTPAEQAGYTTASAPLAKAWLAGINTDASLVNATTPGALNQIVGQVVAKGTPFSLAGALANVNTAQAVVDAFVKATATDVNGDKVKDATDITAAQTKALAAVAADLTATGTSGSLFSTTSSQAVRDALVAAQQAANADTLSNAQGDLADDNAAIAKIAGLSDAVTILTAAQSAQKAANAAEIAASADIQGKEVAFGVNNAGSAVTVSGNNLVFTASGATSATTLATIDPVTKMATLATGVTASNYTGLTDLIASFNAEATTNANLTKANTNLDNAKLMVNMLDVADDATGGITTAAGVKYTTEQALIDAITATINGTTKDTVAAGDTPTLAQIQTELAVLKAQPTQTAYNAFNDLVQAEISGKSDAVALAQATLKTKSDTLKADQTTANTKHGDYNTAAKGFEGGSDVTVSSGKLVFTASGGTSATTIATIDATSGKATEVNPGNDANITSLVAKFNAAVDADVVVAADQKAVGTAQTAYDTAVAAYNPLAAQQATDAAAVDAANAAIAKLAKDVAALKTADANAAILAGDQAAVKAYSDAIKAAGYAVVTLDAAHSGAVTQYGTAASDVFLVSKNSATIAAFGLQGTDALSVGTGYSLVKGVMTGTKAVAGNDAALEIFVSNNASGDAVLQIEQHNYSSNVAGTTGEVVTITLTGVDANTLVLNNGIITITH